MGISEDDCLYQCRNYNWYSQNHGLVQIETGICRSSCPCLKEGQLQRQLRFLRAMFCQVLKICKVQCFTIFLCNLFQNLTVLLSIDFLMKQELVLLQLVIIAFHPFTVSEKSWTQSPVQPSISRSRHPLKSFFNFQIFQAEQIHLSHPFLMCFAILIVYCWTQFNLLMFFLQCKQRKPSKSRTGPQLWLILHINCLLC